ncbi:probable CCR4-associated factor 1 homolog 11 [Brachypodium distachyon]|nr:probable CCR4-associated factor 1 homolog 11 [Brachypodium distachyon]|eukprot:XP_003561201.1 probable CCR4-associated factor 1 homolog 11 [Brachypodium distachyon]
MHPPPAAYHQPLPLPASAKHQHHQQKLTAAIQLQAAASLSSPTIEIREVWKHNLRESLAQIAALLPNYPVICLDTEFPGTIHDDPATPRHLRSAHESYALVRRNADELRHLLQLGLALVGAGGRALPVVWQFNFRGFDPARGDPHSPASIAMLEAHGLDFGRLKAHGIDPRAFADEFNRSGFARMPGLSWVAFSGAYDFAYLAKVLRRGRRLPETLDGFKGLVGRLFGPWVLDVKYIARTCGIRGGLEQVAGALGVERAAGRAHNAGSDSLLTADVLLALIARFFTYVDVRSVYAGAIDGLVV